MTAWKCYCTKKGTNGKYRINVSEVHVFILRPRRGNVTSLKWRLCHTSVIWHSIERLSVNDIVIVVAVFAIVPITSVVASGVAPSAIAAVNDFVLCPFHDGVVFKIIGYYI